MSIFRSMTRILWLGFILVMVLRSESPVPEDSKEKILNCQKPLDHQIHQFPPNSRANKLQSTLKYSHKPLWPLQWQMTEEILTVNGQLYFPSMKVAEMHNMNIKGEGVGVVIIGNTPVNCLHTAIQSRCHAEASETSLSMYPRKSIVNLCRRRSKLCAPYMTSSEVAGIIGMSGDSEHGGVGIAPKCHIGNVVIEPSSRYGSPAYYAAKIISRNTNPPAEVFVHSWILPDHDYKKSVLHAYDDLSLLNFSDKRVVLKPHVMGSGMYGKLANSCQCNEYANADSMFVFGSVSYDGYLVPDSETCASLFGVTYTNSFGCYYYNNIITINSVDQTSFVCAQKSETALSAAMAGGIIALIINCFKRKFQRQPSISDLAFLLAFSSSSETLQDKNMLWFSNGIGLKYSQQAGFGLPNMLNVVSLLNTWTPMEFPIIYEVTRFTRDIEFRCGHESRKRTLTYSSNLVCHFQIQNAQSHLRIQSVSVELSAKLFKRGALSIYLKSPAGTVSCILEGRPYDTGNKNYKKLLLRSNHFIGEQLGGKWSIQFYTYQEDSKPAYSEEALSPTEDKTVQPSSTNAAFHVEENNSNLAPGSLNSNLAPNPSGGNVKSSNILLDGDLSRLRDSKPADLKRDDQLTQKSRVRFNEFVAIREYVTENSGPNFVNDDVLPLQPANEPQKLQRILHESKTGISSANGCDGDSQEKRELVPLQETASGPTVLSLQPTRPQRSQSTLHEPLTHPPTSASVVPAPQPPSPPANSMAAPLVPPYKPSSPINSIPAPLVSPPRSKFSGTSKPAPPIPPLKPPTPVGSEGNDSKPTTRTQKREPNIVNLNQIKFRFVLHESLPLKLNLDPKVKSKNESEKNFALLKGWVDFRHYLFAQLDPQKSQKGREIYLKTENIYSIVNRYVKKLTQLQKNN